MKVLSFRLEIPGLRRRQRGEFAAVGLDIEERRLVEESRPRTSTTFPSIPTSLTVEVPIGFGRTGERSENVPRVDLLFFGLCSTRSRRDRCSQ